MSAQRRWQRFWVRCPSKSIRNPLKSIWSIDLVDLVKNRFQNFFFHSNRFLSIPPQPGHVAETSLDFTISTLQLHKRHLQLLRSEYQKENRCEKRLGKNSDKKKFKSAASNLMPAEVII